MFERRDHDRVPRYETFWCDTIERWRGEGLRGDEDTVRDLLGSDMQDLGWNIALPFPTQQLVLSEDAQTKVVTNEWGETVRVWKNRGGTPQHYGFPCPTRKEWEKTLKPALLANGAQADMELVRQGYARGRQAGRWCFLLGLESFEATRHLLGDEITMIAMAEDPDWVVDVSRTYTDTMLHILDNSMATGVQPDGLWVYGDMAFNHSTMCSPRMYKELIWPDHKRLADWAHARGMKFIYHSDGDINGVLDLYIAAGFDCIQPLEAKARMDIRKLCPKYGEKLAFFGNIDIMILAMNDHAKIEAEVAAKIAAGKATKGYIYHSDHSIPPQVSWDTYQFIIQCADKYGPYSG